MIAIAHHEIKDIPAVGDFCFTTLHTKKGTPIHWIYYVKLKDYEGAW